MPTTSLDQLFPAIQKKANSIYSLYLSPDDIAQNMALGILERSKKDPALFNQTQAYILNAAYLHGGLNFVRSENLCQNHIDDVEIVADFSDEDAECAELVPVDGNAINPEDALIQNENIKAVMTKLDPTNQRIVKLLAQGYTKADVAREIGVTKQSIDERRKTIAKVLAVAYL